MVSDSEDDRLLIAIGQGDERAFNRLVAAHAPRVHAVARRYLGTDADAEDVWDPLESTCRHASLSIL